MKFTHWIIALGVAFCSNVVAARGHQKNIVFILTDDQDQQMDSLQYMPHVKAHLMDKGTRYLRHYAPTALCCPARVSLWTGLLAHNHGVTDVSGVNGGYKEIVKNGLNDEYLPIWLQQQGYNTYYTGKLYNGMHKDLVEQFPVKGWTIADLLIGGHTYQYYNPSFQHIEGGIHKPVYPYHAYSTHMVADYAYDYIDDAVKSEKPFFIGIAPITPHSQVGKNNSGPPVPETNYVGKFSHATVPRTKNFNPSERSGVGVVWDLPQLDTHMEHKLDHYYRRRLEALKSVDDLVLGVIERLNKTNKLEDTYIIYSSDNGFHLGHHRLYAGKKFAFEEDINVPMIIRGPHVPKNVETDIVSAHIDVAPTIFEMAGLKQREEFDGKPIAITREEIQQRTTSAKDEHTAVEFWTGASFTASGLKGRRVNSYKSVRLIGKGYDIMYAVHCHKNDHELYDMTNDPVQMKNLHPSAPAPPGGKNAYHSGTKSLAGFPIHQLLSRVDALLMVLKSCKKAECRHPWQQIHPHAKVKNLRDAMHTTYDQKYHRIPNVKYRECFKNGRIDLHAEGPQWHRSWGFDGKGHMATDTEPDMNLNFDFDSEGEVDPDIDSDVHSNMESDIEPDNEHYGWDQERLLMDQTNFNKKAAGFDTQDWSNDAERILTEPEHNDSDIEFDLDSESGESSTESWNFDSELLDDWE